VKSQEIKPTMSNSNAPINTVAFIALTVFSLVIVVACLMVIAFLKVLRGEKQALQALQAQKDAAEEHAASHDRKVEMTRDSECIPNGVMG
jgi:flagellar biosynthesis/type III secretory pathway M-ring protein FliF/YscJ